MATAPKTRMRSATEAALPIFTGPVFDPLEHRIRNWFVLPGEEGFPGLDAYGWGLHPNGMIDCVNLPGCTHFDGSKQNWANLWSVEASSDDADLFQQDAASGYTQFLGRVIARVMLNPLDPAFCPDPSQWEVLIPLDPGQTTVPDGVLGRLVPKNNVSKTSEDIRISQYTERSGPWSAKVGISTWLKNNHQSR